MTNPDHEWRFYWDRSEFGGSDLFELHPGKLPARKERWWLKGSGFVREENFQPFSPMLHRLVPGFDWYDQTKVSPATCKTLRSELVTVRNAVDRASSMEDLKKAFGYEHIYDEGLPAATLRLYLIKMIDDFIDLLDESIERNEPFWLRGL